MYPNKYFSIQTFSNTFSQVDGETIKRSVTDVCSYSQDLPSRLNELTKKQRDVLMKHVIVNDKYKFLYCYTPKVSFI